jgi:hypothetical protein
MAHMGTEEDRDFLTFMNEQRGDEVHRGGSAKVIETEMVPFAKAPPDQTRNFYFAGPVGTEPPTFRQPKYLYKVQGGEDLSVVDCCKRYLELLEKLVEEFGGRG